MSRLRRVAGLCSSTLSDTANRLLMRTDSEGSSSAAEKKSSAVPFFAAVTCRQSAPDYPRERGDSQEGGNRRCLPSCAPARRQRTFPRSAERNSSLDFKRKTPRPLGANTLTQFEYPAQPVLRNAARIGRTACAVRASQRVGAGIACVAVKPPQLHINYVCVTPTYTV